MYPVSSPHHSCSHSPSRSRSRSRSHSRHSHHSHHSHHSRSRNHTPSRSRSHSRHRSHSRSHSHPHSHSRSRSRSHSRHHQRARSISPLRFRTTTGPYLDSQPDSLSGLSAYSHSPMRRSTSLSELHPRDPYLFDHPLVYRHHSPPSSLRSARRRSRSRQSGDSEHRRDRDRDTLHPISLLDFPALTPGLTFTKPKNFVVRIGNLSAATPWMQVIDEADGIPLILGTGSTLTPTGEAILTDATGRQLVVLLPTRTPSSTGTDDVMIVAKNRYGEALMTAVMPTVSDPHGNPTQLPTYRYGGAMASTQGYPYGYGAQPWNGAAAHMNQIPNFAGVPGQAGNPWQHPTYATPYSNINYLQGGAHAGNLNPNYSQYGEWNKYGDEGLVAVYLSEGRHHGRGSRRKRSKPLFKLVRSADGMREWLQLMDGRELANITYNVAGQAGFAAQGGAYRLFVKAGVDLAMAAAALASRIWIWAETGVTH